MTQEIWYENKDYRSKYIKEEPLKLIIKEWKPTFGLPVVNKKFKNYKLMRKWYPKHRYDKRGFLKLEISDQNEKIIKKKSNEILKKYFEDSEKEIKNSVNYKLGFPKYMKCKLRMGYDNEKKKFLNNVQSKIKYNGEDKYNVNLEDLEKMMYKCNNTILKISINKVWENDELYGCNWVIDEIRIEKNKSRLESSSDEE